MSDKTADTALFLDALLLSSPATGPRPLPEEPPLREPVLDRNAARILFRDIVLAEGITAPYIDGRPGVFSTEGARFSGQTSFRKVHDPVESHTFEYAWALFFAAPADRVIEVFRQRSRGLRALMAESGLKVSIHRSERRGRIGAGVVDLLVLRAELRDDAASPGLKDALKTLARHYNLKELL